MKGLKHFKCKSADETKEFFANNIIGLDMFSYSPTLKNESEEAMKLQTSNIHFSTHYPAGQTSYKEIGFSLSHIELEDSWMTKFFTSTTEHQDLIIYDELIGR